MSPRTTEQFAEMKDQRRERILDAALGVFARRGLEAARVSELAAAAGMSQGLLYRYFPSKEAVFGALVDHAATSGRALVERAIQRPGTPWDRLEYLATAMLDGVRDRPEYVALVSQVAGPGAPAEARAALAWNGQVTFEHVVRLLAEGQAAGQVAPGNPVELARAYFALIQGLALGQTRDEGSAQPFPRPEIVLRLFKPEPGAPSYPKGETP